MSISFSEDAQQEVVTSSRVLPEDSGEGSLRPRLLKDYTGQEKAKENLQVCIDAARLRGEPLDHVLLYGPPGLGKTTMAAVIANEMGVNMRITSGPAIEKAGDLAALLTNLQEHDILFVDEIHRLNRAVEEILYPAMEDYAIDIIIGKGPSANSIRLDLPRFTLIGATTRAGQLTAPLRDRFGVNLRLELYSPAELQKIVERSAGILKVEIDSAGAYEIASRSRGTPRIANRLLKRVRDYAQVRADGVITKEVANAALLRLEVDEMGLDATDRRMLRSIIEFYHGGPVGLETLAATIGEEAVTQVRADGVITKEVANAALLRLEVDEMGLDATDRRMLRSIIEFYHGGPVGLETLAATIGEEAVTLEDVYEPYLLQQGFLTRTPRGRCVTRRAYEHLGLEYIGQQEIDL